VSRGWGSYCGRGSGLFCGDKSLLLGVVLVERQKWRLFATVTAQCSRDGVRGRAKAKVGEKKLILEGGQGSRRGRGGIKVQKEKRQRRRDQKGRAVFVRTTTRCGCSKNRGKLEENAVKDFQRGR